jgi:hypothetical protein
VIWPGVFKAASPATLILETEQYCTVAASRARLESSARFCHDSAKLSSGWFVNSRWGTKGSFQLRQVPIRSQGESHRFHPNRGQWIGIVKIQHVEEFNRT